MHLAATYSMVDREKDALAVASEALGINPKFSVESYAKTRAYFFRDQSEADKVVNALCKAGLK